MELHLYDVILRPIVTEKTNLMSSDFNQFVFEVASTANKHQIREAVEVIFDVEVTSVRTMVMPAKRGRRGRNWYVRAKQWKKAVVTLKEGDTIELFNL